MVSSRVKMFRRGGRTKQSVKKSNDFSAVKLPLAEGGIARFSGSFTDRTRLQPRRWAHEAEFRNS
jgi:hypothetical protein